MKEKKHYKLYKSGKLWKTVALTAATVAGVISASTLTGNADTTNASTQGSTPANQQATVVTTASDSNAVDTNKTNVQTPAASPVANDTTASDSTVKTGWQQAADKSWTYYNNDGKANTGREYSLMPTIGDTTGKSKSWYLMQDGKALSDVQEWQGSYWYFDNSNYQLHKKWDNITARWGMNYLVGDDGQIKSGVQKWQGEYLYYDPTTYLLNQKWDYVQSQWGDWYMVGDDGRVKNGVQKWQGSYWYFDPNTYLLSKKQNYVQSQWGDWYMVGNDGRIQSGLVNWMGNTYYFDPVTYLRTDNKDFTVNGISYHADGNGVVNKLDVNSFNIPKGTQNTFYYNSGKVYFVKPDGNLAKNEEVQTPVGKLYFDKNGIVAYTGISSSRDAFLSSIVNGAVQGWVEHGVLPSLTLAQAIIESGWGQSTLSSRYHNLFGIKARNGWTGKVANMPTGEYINGKYVVINDGFRAYDNNDQSVKDHALFLVQNSRYSNLLWDKNYTSVTRKIQQDGYATAPTYATTLQNTIRAYALDDYDRIAFAIKK